MNWKAEYKERVKKQITIIRPDAMQADIQSAKKSITEYFDPGLAASILRYAIDDGKMAIDDDDLFYSLWCGLALRGAHKNDLWDDILIIEEMLDELKNDDS